MRKYLLKDNETKRRIIRSIFLSVICLLSSVICFSAWADYSLSVEPVEQAENIQFGRVSFDEHITKEVKVTITSDTAQQYQVRQQLISPLTNDSAEVLGSQGIIFYTLRDSNVYGSLYQDTPYNLDTLESVLYTSSTDGLGDSFIIAYTVKGEDLTASGSFLGRLRYSLLPLGEEGAEQEVIMNVYLDAESKFDIEYISSSQSVGRLELLEDEEDKDYKGSFSIDIKGILGEKYTIYQRIDSEFKNEEEKPAAVGICGYKLLSEKQGAVFADYTALSKERALVYSSDLSGDADSIKIDFLINKEDLTGLAGGVFTAELLYTVESAEEGIIKSIPLKIEFENSRIFDIEVSSEEGAGLSFKNLKSMQTVEQELEIKVKSNLKKPYVVAQRLTRPLTNEKGDIVPLEFFRLKGEVKAGRGQFIFPEPTALETGDTEIFVSDKEGTPVELKLTYILETPRDMRAGDYSTELSYSLIEK